MITIRRATADDRLALAEFGACAFSDTFAEENTPENMAVYLAMTFTPEKQGRELADPDVRYFIAEQDDTIVGSVKLIEGMAPSCIEGDRPIEIARLYVGKNFFRCGIGSRLMERCFEEARELHSDVVWLGVWEHNERARNFYRAWKFAEVGSHVFQLGDDPQRDLLLQRAVGDIT